jgi:hypothetical protein
VPTFNKGPANTPVTVVIAKKTTDVARSTRFISSLSQNANDFHNHFSK